MAAELRKFVTRTVHGVWVLLAACAGTSLDVGSTDAGTGGSAGSGAVSACERALPEPVDVGCDWRAALGAPGQSGFCYKGGCHNASTRAGELDFTPDAFLVSRLLNVPAQHDIECPGAISCEPEKPACEHCYECPPGQLLINTSDPYSSWIIRKLAPFVPGVTTTTFSFGCGDAMPSFNTTGTANYTQDHKDCLIAFFNYLARTPGNWPCAEF